MSVKKEYIEVINYWLRENYEENDLELLMTINGIENINNRKIELLDVFYKGIVTSDSSDIYETYTSLTHVFSFNDLTILIECLGKEYNYEVFDEINHYVDYSYNNGLQVALIDPEDEEENFSMVLINILKEVGLSELWEEIFNEFNSKIIDEIMFEKLIKLEDAQLIFPNVIKVEAESLDTTKLYIADDIHFPFDNKSLIKALKSMQEKQKTTV